MRSQKCRDGNHAACDPRPATAEICSCDCHGDDEYLKQQHFTRFDNLPEVRERRYALLIAAASLWGKAGMKDGVQDVQALVARAKDILYVVDHDQS